MVANICIAIFIIRLHKVSVHGKLCIWTVSNRKNELAECYGYRDYHVYIGRYLGAFNLLGWKVGEKHYRLKGTLSNLVEVYVWLIAASISLIAANFWEKVKKDESN